MWRGLLRAGWALVATAVTAAPAVASIDLLWWLRR